MAEDTDIGGQAASFPLTRSSLLAAIAGPEPPARKQALENLAALYWKPIYKYIRIRWSASNEDAKDLTQAFFAQALDKAFFERYDPTRARFRTYLRLCIDGFLSHHRQAAQAAKRGGGIGMVPLDFAPADGNLKPGSSISLDPEESFRREWLRELFTQAVDDLRDHCEHSGKSIHFKLFEHYDLEPTQGLTYAQLGHEFGLSDMQVTNYLAYARRQFKHFVLERLRAATQNDEEFREEARRYLGGNLL
jgi:RNA polymerase sigma factor (sigma-70 family)